MNRMSEIAAGLGAAYKALRTLELGRAHKQEDLAARKLYLTPPSGWEGKNEEQRKTAAEKAFAEDEVCKGLATLLRENEGRIAELTGLMQALEAERRALEWETRLRLVDALRGQEIAVSRGPVEETAFDDASQSEADRTLQVAVEVTTALAGAVQDALLPHPNGWPTALEPAVQEAELPF